MKRILKWIGGLLLGILLLLIGLRLYYTPSYNSTEHFADLKEETGIIFDTHGIPHIYAEQATDAYFAMGWVHAKERLWQMDLLRRAASGRLSKAFGEKFVRADQFMLNLGIAENSRKSVEALQGDEPWLELANAYLSGVNAYIDQEKPSLEYVLARVEREPFELIDIYNSIGYMAFTFAHAPKTDPFLSHVRDSLGPEYLKALSIEVDTSRARIPVFDPEGGSWASLDRPFMRLADEIGEIPSAPFIGSNSWVIGPTKTKEGAVILANDPHMKFAQPAVWYETHLAYPGYEVYGFYIAGIPFPLLHHNRFRANGLTMFTNDDFDFYDLTIDEDKDRYTVPGPMAMAPKIEKVPYQIEVKGGESVSFEVRKTHLGPIIDQRIDSAIQRPLAMHWVFTDRLNELPGVLYEMNYSKTFAEFREALRDLHAPGLNIMYGDSQGNYAWFATAQLFRLTDSVSTKFSLSADERIRNDANRLNFDQNPRSINPPWGFVYSANNPPKVDSLYIPGYYLPSSRGLRISGLLESTSDWDLEATQEMMSDVRSLDDQETCQLLISVLELESMVPDQQAWVEELRDWDGNYALQNLEPGFFHQWVYRIASRAFRDELGEERFQLFLSTHLFKRSIAPLIENPDTVWWDDLTTPGLKETRAEVINAAFTEAWNYMKTHYGDTSNWQWYRMHTLEHKHPLGEVPLIGKWWNVGPDPVAGSREVINNMLFPYTGEDRFEVLSGPSTRRIIDFSDVAHSKAILPTGQSGNPFSPFYSDQRRMYLRGEFRTMYLDSVEIRANQRGRIRLLPE